MSEFRTMKGYDMLHEGSLTSAMEDYLEMICRLTQDYGYARIGQLSQRLNVSPSAATKTAKQLKDAGYVDYEKYGYITPTEKGIEAGEYLLHRHDVLHRFLRLINGSEEELEQVERIEHFLNCETVYNIERILEKLSG